MSKICFVTMGNLYLCPYIESYISNLEDEYDIIYWDRDNIEESTNARCVYKFSSAAKVSRDKKVLKKIWGYLRFYFYANKILSKNNYDCIILLQTLAGIITSRTLLGKYSKKYILDIRDYTFENNRFFYSIERKLIYNSQKTIISSEGFKLFLPNFDYIMTHNSRELVNQDLVRSIKGRNKKKDKLNIAFIGYISYLEQHKKLLLKLKNNPKFVLSFIGKEANVLKGFCEKNGIKNVRIIDKFPPEKILNYYVDVDLINNLYGNGTPILDYALSNKLYFAAQLNIPILVCPKTYIASISEKYGFGFELDLLEDDDIAEKLIEFYKNINWESLSRGCDEFMEKVNKDNNDFVKIIKQL